MKRTMTTAAVLLSGIALLITACGAPPNVGTITYLDEEVFVFEEELPEGSVVPADSRVAPRGRGNRRRVDEFEYQITRVAQIPPVDVAGAQVQANDILMDGTSAYVVHNTAGAVFAGAFQVVDFRQPLRPVITTEVGLPNADVNAVAFTDTHVYIAGAWNPDDIADYDPAEPDRAFVARIAKADLGTVTAEDIAAGKVILDSFVATGIAIKDSTVFVSTGALDGELEILGTDLSQTGSAPYGDLRDIEAYRGGVIALQGTDNSGLADGRVLTLQSSGSQKDELFITDFGSPEKKATIEVYEQKYAFLGLSEAGFQVVYLKDDSEAGDPVESVFSIENPTGLDWTTRTDTNSASYADDILVTANGEAGFRMFRVTQSLDKDEPVTDFVEKVGFVPFDETGPDTDGNYWSANHVEYSQISSSESASAGYLAVASGTGGVNLYYLRTK